MKAYNLQEYNMIFDTKRKNYLSGLIVAFILIGIIIFIFKFNFYVYEKYFLIKNNDNYSMIVDATKIDKLNDYIYINNRRYKYKVISINDDYQTINGTIYQTVYIKLDYGSNSNIIECYFLKSKKTVINMIIEALKGG